MVTRLTMDTMKCSGKTMLDKSNTFVSFKSTSDVDLYCLWCNFKIDNAKLSVGCPLNRRAYRSYDTYGIFCSFNCAKAFAVSNCKKPQFMHSVRLLKLMYNENNDGEKKPFCDIRNDDYNNNNNTDVDTIIESPNPILMRRYGGYMTDNQYLESIGKIRYDEKYPIAFNWVTVPFEEFR